MMTEKEYSRKVSLEHRKKFAQFFTPEPIATFMATWLMQGLSKDANIMEPAFGLGAFSRELLHLFPNISITGDEIDQTIFQIAQSNFSATNPQVSIRLENYLESSWNESFDGIICNPPYFKFHDYDNGKYVPAINKRLNTKLNGFTNIYTLFLLKSIAQLKEGGRLAYLVPSEFLNSDYGVEVKRALLSTKAVRHIIVIDFTQCAFDDALTTACILLCEKTDATKEVRFSRIGNTDKLEDALSKYQSVKVDALNPEEKWRQYYESSQALKYQHLVPFSTFAKVSRGIATGANKYFTFNKTQKDLYKISDECFKPCVCHAIDVHSQIFTQEDFDQLANADKYVYLLDACNHESSPHIQQYIHLGEEAGINGRFLTANRSPWYALENRPPSPIWVSVFNRNGLRFVRNKTAVYNLTTFHCVYNNSEIDTDVLFSYLITDIAKEIFLDNSRQYGNGLIKFEPNDLNKGKVVDLRLLSEEEIQFISNVYKKLQYYGSVSEKYISILNHFFYDKYALGVSNIDYYYDELNSIKTDKVVKVSKKLTPLHIKQLNFLDLFEQYAFDCITENSMVSEDINTEYGKSFLYNDKNVLISLVKADNTEQYIDQSAMIYYTGKRFPSTIALNKLYYFMPYIKCKGIRDLYLIKTIRVGTRKEGQPDNTPNEFRLVFEIEFVKQFFDDYKPINLDIWHTFTDTTIRELQEIRIPTRSFDSYQEPQAAAG